MALPHLKTFLYAIFYGVTFMKFSLGSDTLLSNQSIANSQTLISGNQIFELGFFAPGSSRNAFLGIWYKSTPDVVVWVANRNNPIPDSQGAVLSISRNGTPVISRGRMVIWSANSSSVASNPTLQLLDTGNLVIIDKDSRASPKRSYVWQSFDYPCDTKLPGMKMVSNPGTGEDKYLTSWRNSDDPSPGGFTYRIQNHGLPEFVLFQGATKSFRTGPWNGLYFSGMPPSPSQTYRPELVFNNGILVSSTEPQTSVVARVKLDQLGVLRRYSLDEREDRWNLVYTMPRDPCANYAQCGPYGICDIDNEPICKCLEGFVHTAQQDWDKSGGCARIKPLNCLNGGDFLEVKGVKFPDMLNFKLNTSMSLGECHDECLRNCNCTAYANVYITGGGSGCIVWFGDLIDMRVVVGADHEQKIYIRLSELGKQPSSTNLGEKEKNKLLKLILPLVAGGVLITCLIGGCLQLKRRASRSKTENFELPSFKLATIAAATSNFLSENMIGEGGFGPVYRGNFSVEEEIAVKRLSKTSCQGLDEFKNEVILIAKLQHRNLVRLLGCCIEGDERLLIYEYMKNGSLDYFVFDETRKKLLTWPKRFDIIMGIARGILYLHHDSRLNIIHRDLKTSNILLDENLNPKVSDFGLARTFGGDQTISRTKRVIGTYGYMAPEYAIDGKFSVKSDIFSVGVILLEIVSGKKNRGFNHCNHHHTLLGHAWLLWKEKKAMELMDECLKDTCVESQVKRCIQVGLLCVQKFAENRPMMSSVLFMLGSEGVILPEPNEPGFFMERSSNGDAENHASASIGSKRDSMTITDMEPR